MKNLKIFLVDDDHMQLNLTVTFIKRVITQKVLVLPFDDLHSAIGEFSYKPDLIVTDYSFGDDTLSTEQFIKFARNKFPDAKIVVMSSNNNAELAVDLIKCGANEFIHKDGKALYKLEWMIKDTLHEINYRNRKSFFKIIKDFFVGLK